MFDKHLTRPEKCEQERRKGNSTCAQSNRVHAMHAENVAARYYKVGMCPAVHRLSCHKALLRL